MKRVWSALVVLMLASAGAWAWTTFSGTTIDLDWLTHAAPGTSAAPTAAAGAPQGEGAPGADAPPGAVPARPADATALTVERVVDGDTIRAHSSHGELFGSSLSQRIRLIGIDTPEVSGAAECGGPEATDALRALLPEGATVWAAPDVDAHDRYDRWLLYLWTDDGRFVNYELMASGAAEALDIAPNSAHAALFAGAQTHAQSAGLGRWGACG